MIYSFLRFVRGVPAGCASHKSFRIAIYQALLANLKEFLEKD
jgi:hypothetical protein